ncbi:MAG: manganese-dependent inorganic pyrophosphatase [Nanoarchaeota archaeon]|nr:manganese-dependent inorganic pyrophosphatase [Nanoarchaeota archaeon]
MGDKIIVVGHKSPDTDSIVAAIAYAYFKGKVDLDDEYVPARAGELNPETEYVLKLFNVPVPELVEDVSGKKVILVDHNEMGQVVNGTHEATILEIIDHHKIGGLQTSSPILFHAEPIGSTCTIVADFFFYHNIKLTKELASILLAGILSDTVIFKSPTTTEKDKNIANKLNEIAKLDIQKFGLDVKKSKSSIKGLSANDLIMSDFKEFEKEGFKYGVGQIEVVHYDEAVERKKEIISELKNIGDANGLNMALLMVTNIIEESTKLWFTSHEDLIKKAFNQPVKDNEVFLKGVMSRKKQVVPKIQDII